MKNLVRKSDGFTLVELMVVVAIIGILSAIAVPNFKKYQAKSKQSEAKIQLAMVYTVENTAMADYDTYAACLSFLGYDVPARGYYSVGFTGAPTTGNNVVRNRSGSALCTDAATQSRLTPGALLFAGDGGAAAATLTGPTALAQSTFTAGAVGNLQTNAWDAWTINEAKTLSNTLQGF